MCVRGKTYCAQFVHIIWPAENRVGRRRTACDKNKTLLADVPKKVTRKCDRSDDKYARRKSAVTKQRARAQQVGEHTHSDRRLMAIYAQHSAAHMLSHT